MHEPSSVEPQVCHEEVPAIESGQLESQYVDSTLEPSPELKFETPEKEDPQPQEFLQNFEEDRFEDYGNTSNYSYQRRPQVPVTPLDPSEKEYLCETIKGLTIMMSDEWLKEGELSSKPIQINSPSSPLCCRIKNQDVDILYNPTVGANLIRMNLC